MIAFETEVPGMGRAAHYAYGDFGGERVLGREDLERVWFKLVQEGLADRLFYEGGVECSGDFIDFAEDGQNQFFLAFQDEAPVAVWWLNGFSARSASIHQVFFRGFWGRFALQTARQALARLLNYRDREGGHVLDLLRGLTPETNGPALAFLRRVGFREAGTMPMAAYLAGEKRSVGAVLSYITRKEVSAWAEEEKAGPGPAAT